MAQPPLALLEPEQRSMPDDRVTADGGRWTVDGGRWGGRQPDPSPAGYFLRNPDAQRNTLFWLIAWPGGSEVIPRSWG